MIPDGSQSHDLGYCSNGPFMGVFFFRGRRQAGFMQAAAVLLATWCSWYAIHLAINQLEVLQPTCATPLHSSIHYRPTQCSPRFSRRRLEQFTLHFHIVMLAAEVQQTMCGSATPLLSNIVTACAIGCMCSYNSSRYIARRTYDDDDNQGGCSEPQFQSFKQRFFLYIYIYYHHHHTCKY